jgi:hypothetical protein
MRAVGRGQIANDRGRATDVVQLLRRRILGRRIALQNNADAALASYRFLDRGNRGLAADVDRHHESRK